MTTPPAPSPAASLIPYFEAARPVTRQRLLSQASVVAGCLRAGFLQDVEMLMNHAVFALMLEGLTCQDDMPRR